MIELTFVTGAGLRKVFIKDKVATLLTAEYSYTPITINLQNKELLTQSVSKIDKNNEEQKEFIDSLVYLVDFGSDEDIAKDIIKDFQLKGWRLVKRI